MVHLSLTFITLVLSIPLVLTFPLESRTNPDYKPSRHMAGLPANTTHLSIDATTGDLTAYDKNRKPVGTLHPSKHGANVTSRQSQYSACTAMANSDIQKMPGWSALLADAQSLFGKGSFNSVANDPGYPQYPASICTDLSTVTVTANAQPECSVQESTTHGTLVGTSGSVTLTSTQGTSYSTTTTVTQSAALAVGATFGVKLTVPGVEESESFSVTSTFTNTLSTSSQTTVNQQQSEGITMVAPIGSTCNLSFTTKACTTTGSGSVREAATGWAWFEYKSKTQGHYLWALNLDYYLTLDQRSSFINFKAAVQSSTLSGYTGQCA
ncbi:hypothetical protein MVEN_01998000 [Mycena venus]|uniref:Uncharacterized protein n=1 Tax=Mycena venus TaxID=2733690 RepID=A0A8H7CK66_9AGAR|nr:hypothetical protein MVEN_01998000 [Mycena venus]